MALAAHCPWVSPPSCPVLCSLELSSLCTSQNAAPACGYCSQLWPSSGTQAKAVCSQGGSESSTLGRVSGTESVAAQTVLRSPQLVTSNTVTTIDIQEHRNYTGWTVEDWEGRGMWASWLHSSGSNGWGSGDFNHCGAQWLLFVGLEASRKENYGFRGYRSPCMCANRPLCSQPLTVRVAQLPRSLDTQL